MLTNAALTMLALPENTPVNITFTKALTYVAVTKDAPTSVTFTDVALSKDTLTRIALTMMN